MKIRMMCEADAQVIYDTYLSYGWHPSLQTYREYYQENCSGRRSTFCCEIDGKLAGHVSLIHAPFSEEAGPYAGTGIPLVSDFSVFIEYRRRGIGTALMDAVETAGAAYADRICLAVGCHAGYGTAQRMYVKRGYIPDGSGIWWNGQKHEPYAPCVNDDDLLLWMCKNLTKT